MKRSTMSALAALAVTVGTHAQVRGWEQLTVSPAPTARRVAAMATDPVRGEVVLFGGSISSGGSDETWVWDGRRWTLRQPAHDPGPRSAPAMCFDTARGRVLLFGGMGWQNGLPTFPTDTWEWDGQDWTKLPIPDLPNSLTRPQLVHAPAHGRTVLIEPLRSPGTGWELTPNGWQPWGGAGLTQLVGLGYDAARDEFVAMDLNPQGRLDTWVWDGAGWLLRSPTAPMTARTWTRLLTAPDGGLFMTGGTVFPIYFDDLWYWDGATWQVPPMTSTYAPARHETATALDVDGRSLLLFGGRAANNLLGDLWRMFEHDELARVESYGSGCAGSAGTPSLAAAAGSRPVLGTTLELELASLPPSRCSAVWGLYGTSRDAAGSLPLPLDLAVIGMPGCLLWTSAEGDMPVENRGGHARWNTPLPLQAPLLGRPVYLQALVLDPGVNALGATLSNGLAVTPGGR